MLRKTTSIIAIVLVSLLMGCVSTQVVVNRMGDRYVGRNVDQFILEHGMPQQKMTLNSGDIVYAWSSSGRVAIPMTATTTGYSTSGMLSANTYVSGGGSVGLECSIQMITSANGTVKNITILRDTIGFWTTSMCHETLGRTSNNQPVKSIVQERFDTLETKREATCKRPEYAALIKKGFCRSSEVAATKQGDESRMTEELRQIFNAYIAERNEQRSEFASILQEYGGEKEKAFLKVMTTKIFPVVDENSLALLSGSITFGQYFIKYQEIDAIYSDEWRKYRLHSPDPQNTE